MTQANSFKIEGLDQVLRKLKSLQKDIAFKIERKALRKSLELVKSEAERLAPVDRTGKVSKNSAGKVLDQKPLADSFKISAPTKQKSYYEVRLVSRAPHAVLMEFGFFHTGPEPRKIRGEFVKGKAFMRPAVDTKAKEAVEIFKSEVESAIKKLGQGVKQNA